MAKPDKSIDPATLHHIWEHHYGSDFAAGVRLLEEHNPTAVTPGILQRLQKIAATGKGLSRYDTGKLADALRKTAVPGAVPGIPDAPPPPPPLAVPELPAAADIPAVAEAPATPEPTLTSEAAKALHKEHAHVHALMVSATDDATRAAHAKDIMERINPALDAEYDRLLATPANDTPAEEKPEAPLHSTPGPILNKTDADNYKKLQSVRSRISRLKKELIPKATDPKRKAQLEQELAGKLAERDNLENALK